jgi:hypothetical protein
MAPLAVGGLAACGLAAFCADDRRRADDTTTRCPTAAITGQAPPTAATLLISYLELGAWRLRIADWQLAVGRLAVGRLEMEIEIGRLLG